MKVIFKTDLSCLFSLVFVSLTLAFVHILFSCFDLLFLLVLEFILTAREFTYCHIRNVQVRLALYRVCGVRADLSSNRRGVLRSGESGGVTSQ